MEQIPRGATVRRAQRSVTQTLDIWIAATPANRMGILHFARPPRRTGTRVIPECQPEGWRHNNLAK